MSAFTNRLYEIKLAVNTTIVKEETIPCPDGSRKPGNKMAPSDVIAVKPSKSPSTIPNGQSETTMKSGADDSQLRPQDDDDDDDDGVHGKRGGPAGGLHRPGGAGTQPGGLGNDDDRRGPGSSDSDVDEDVVERKKPASRQMSSPRNSYGDQDRPDANGPNGAGRPKGEASETPGQATIPTGSSGSEVDDGPAERKKSSHRHTSSPDGGHGDQDGPNMIDRTPSGVDDPNGGQRPRGDGSGTPIGQDASDGSGRRGLDERDPNSLGGKDDNTDGSKDADGKSTSGKAGTLSGVNGDGRQNGNDDGRSGVDGSSDNRSGTDNRRGPDGALRMPDSGTTGENGDNSGSILRRTPSSTDGKRSGPSSPG